MLSLWHLWRFRASGHRSHGIWLCVCLCVHACVCWKSRETPLAPLSLGKKITPWAECGRINFWCGRTIGVGLLVGPEEWNFKGKGPEGVRSNWHSKMLALKCDLCDLMKSRLVPWDWKFWANEVHSVQMLLLFLLDCFWMKSQLIYGS